MDHLAADNIGAPQGAGEGGRSVPRPEQEYGEALQTLRAVVSWWFWKRPTMN